MLWGSKRLLTTWRISQKSRSSHCLPMAASMRLLDSVYQIQRFAHIHLPADHQFAQTNLSYAFVNLKPIVEGHVLCCPKRVVKRFAELSLAEVADVWQLAQLVGSTLEKELNASSLTMAIQDGPDAGQSIAHVHIHVLPRRKGDFQRNDDIYAELDTTSRGTDRDRLDMDKERPPRSDKELVEEAAKYRQWFASA